MRMFSLLPLIAVGLFGSGCSSSDPPAAAPPSVDAALHGRLVCDRAYPVAPRTRGLRRGGELRTSSRRRIQTTFTYRKGSFDAPQKSMHPIGRVEKEGNGAIWGMQFIWPIQAEYVIAWLDESYRQTIVARSKRDYVWYMARTTGVRA